MCFAHMCMCTSHMCSRNQKKMSDPLQLELQTIVSCHMGSGRKP